MGTSGASITLGAALLVAASKVLSIVIDARLRELLKEAGIEEQNTFSGGWGCLDRGFCAHTKLKKRRKHGLESWVLFLFLGPFAAIYGRTMGGTCRDTCTPSPDLYHLAHEQKPRGIIDLNFEIAAVPCSWGAKRIRPLVARRPPLFSIQTCLGFSSQAMAATATH